MNRSLATITDRIRRPEYTGENRCVPCTIVNPALAIVASTTVSFLSLPAGIVTFCLSITSIYFRGYLVPGTPRFTERYFPARVLRWFEKAPDRRSTGTDGTAEAFDVEAALLRIGAVEECADRDDLCLRDPFREAWHGRIEAAREREPDREALVDFLDLDDGAVTFEEHGEAFVARTDGGRIGRWESYAAFLADVAAASVLTADASLWTDLTVPERAELLGGLRLFLDRCPACDGSLAFGERTVESCCRSTEVVELACEECGARLFEIDATPLSA